MHRGSQPIMLPKCFRAVRRIDVQLSFWNHEVWYCHQNPTSLELGIHNLIEIKKTNYNNYSRYFFLNFYLRHHRYWDSELFSQKKLRQNYGPIIFLWANIEHDGHYQLFVSSEIRESSQSNSLLCTVFSHHFLGYYGDIQYCFRFFFPWQVSCGKGSEELHGDIWGFKNG